MYAEALRDVTGVYSQVGLFNGAMLLHNEAGVFIFKNDDSQWEINESIRHDRPVDCAACLVATDDREALTDVVSWVDSRGTTAEIKVSDCGESGEPRGKSCQCDEV